MPSPKMEFHFKNKGVQKEAIAPVFVTGDPRRQYDEVFETRQALGASIHWYPAYNDGVQGEVRSCCPLDKPRAPQLSLRHIYICSCVSCMCLCVSSSRRGQFAKKMGVGFGEVDAANMRDTSKGGRATFAGNDRLRWEARYSGQPAAGTNPTYWIETKDGLTFDQRAAREKRNDPYSRSPPKPAVVEAPNVSSPKTPPAGQKYTEK